jgi:transcriptional regulator
MYVHSYSRVNESKEVFDFINHNGFAIMVSTVEGKLWASHIPLVLSADGKTLIGHVSRGNKASKNFTEHAEVLCVFQGPHTYISSSWYDHENVSTWNYLAAQVRGIIQVLSREELLSSLKDLTSKYEKNSEKPATVESMDPKYVEKEMKGIVGFKIVIKHVEASFKLSQNRDAKNHTHIMKKLEERGDAQSLEIMEAMKKQQLK